MAAEIVAAPVVADNSSELVAALDRLEPFAEGLEPVPDNEAAPGKAPALALDTAAGVVVEPGSD